VLTSAGKKAAAKRKNNYFRQEVSALGRIKRGRKPLKQVNNPLATR
jgi:hypothetical protein